MKEMRTCFVLILLSAWLQISGQSNLAEIGVSESGLVIQSASHMSLSDDASETAEVINGNSDDQFSALTAFSELLDPDIRQHWIRLDMKNTMGEARSWILDFESWTMVDAYVPHEGELVHLRSGHLLPYNDRDFVSANKSLIALDFQENEAKILYIKLESSVNFLQIPVTLDFKVFSEQSFRKVEMNRRMALGLFSGFYIIMLLYNLFIFFSTRDNNYIPYLIALLGAVLITFHLQGHTVSILNGWEGYVHVHSKMQFFSSQILGASMLIFAAMFLDIKNRYPRYYTAIKILLVAIVFLPLPSLLGYANLNEKISGMLGIITMIFILTVSIKSYKDRYPSSGLFLLGYGAFAVGIVVMLCTFIGILPLEIQEYYPVNIGSTVEMVFFSLALGNRINLLAHDNELKQAQIIDQLREKEELQSNINRNLEIKVAERTKEIEHQKVLIEGEKEKADKLLLNILPESVATELKEKGAATPKAHEGVSVLFADLVGFTKRSEGMTPAEVISELDYCFQAFDDIVESHGLEKIKTIGDGYMCAGGVPISAPNTTLNAVKAALAMQQFMDEWSAQKEKEGGKDWKVRIGVHTGEVIAGVVGKKKFAYDIWGDTVNTASRLEFACEAGKVNISGATHDELKGELECEYRGKIESKGKEVEMYYALSIKE